MSRLTMNKRFPEKVSIITYYVATAVIIPSVVCYPVILNWKSDSVFELDMAPNSVDDQFTGCEDIMYKGVKDRILPRELKINKNFSAAWKKYKDISNYLERIIKVYTSNLIYNELNEAVSKSRNNYTKKHKTAFIYKACHFLLTLAIQNHQVKPCTDVFRGTKVTFNRDVLNHEMRFGRFTSTSLNNNKMTQFGSISCFKIKTCFGADISSISVFPKEEEVLIPPYEKFKITKIEDNQMNCSVLYTLHSTGKFSNMNCDLFK